MKIFRLRQLSLALIGSALITLAGCGGGSSSTASTGGGTNGSSNSGNTTAATVGVSTTVVDGAIKNATVCLDKNNNGQCDAGEPTGTTDANGNVTIQVAASDVGMYPLVAVVTTASVDADSGTVTVPFTLKAPADHSSVVSPLTTLVQQVVDANGGTSAQAAATIQNQTGLNVSLFENFATDSSTSGQAAAALARLVVVTTQQQTQSLTAAVGSSDSSGAVISTADLTKAIQAAVVQLLPSVAAAAADPTVQTACASGLNNATCQAAIATQASSIASQTGLTTSTVATVVGVNKQIVTSSSTTSTTATTPVAGGNLRWFSASAANNWNLRMFTQSAAQATPDANGMVHYVDTRMNSVPVGTSSVAATTNTWGFQSDPNRAGDLHWNGSAWVACTYPFASSQTVRDANGVSTSNYCDGFNISVSKRAAVDISGKTMASIVSQIKAYPFLDNGPYGNSYSTWGPSSDPTTLFGTTTFPSGSQLLYQTSNDQSYAQAYDVRASNIVAQTNANVAAGGNAITGTPACGSVLASTPSASWTVASSTLESLIAVNAGTPCIYPANSLTSTLGTFSSGSRNDWWGQSTLNVGSYGTAPSGPASNFYSALTDIRVAFGANNSVTWYSCQMRWTDGSPRNCNSIGTGTYNIATLGDGRVLTLTGAPAQSTPLNYNRVFVERGGAVYYGYQPKMVVSNQLRLNLPATNALFAYLTTQGAIGLPTFNP